MIAEPRLGRNAHEWPIANHSWHSMKVLRKVADSPGRLDRRQNCQGLRRQDPKQKVKVLTDGNAIGAWALLGVSKCFCHAMASSFSFFLLTCMETHGSKNYPANKHHTLKPSCALCRLMNSQWMCLHFGSVCLGLATDNVMFRNQRKIFGARASSICSSCLSALVFSFPAAVD